MRVVVDNNLPRSLARLLGQAGLEAAHVVDLQVAHASDQTLRERFAHEELIWLSRDDDFWTHHPPGWTVVWLALHNPTLAQLKGPIARTLTGLLPRLRPGQRVLVAADQVRVFGS